LFSQYDAKFIRQLCRFIVAGIANTAIGLSIILFLVYLGYGALLANFIGYSLSFAIGFFVSKNWTFESKQPVRTTAPLFMFSAAVSYILNIVAVVTLQHQTSLGPYLVQVGGVATYAVSMFFLCRALVFKSRGY
jgi:putative flippase GtrA